MNNMVNVEYSCLVKHKEKLRDTDERLLGLIAKRTNIPKEDIRHLDIENIEEKAGIVAKAKRDYFNWENGEKDGWQTMRFVGEAQLNKRELRMDEELVIK